MKMAWLGLVTFCVFTMALGCRTASPDWNGTWRINPSKGNFQGPIFTISISADGEYRFDNGRPSFAFRCDGKERQIGNNRTRVCVKSSATVLDLTQKENGLETSTNRWELSDDGKVLTMTATALRPSGPIVIAQLVASRISGSSDFAGQWRDTSYLQSHAEMTLRIDNRILHIAYPNAGQYIDAPFDGVDAPVYGPHAPKGMTYTARLVGQREILTLTKSNGKALIQGSLQLSGDGNVVTETWWNPGQPANKGIIVYERK